MYIYYAYNTLGAIDSMTEIKRIYQLIESDHFRTKPNLYIGDRNITTLYNFLNGAFFALKIHEVESRESEPDFRKFHDWVADHYNWFESTAGWKNIILKECDGDEEKALDVFFNLYDEFKKGTS